jgi:hypothetical protein
VFSLTNGLLLVSALVGCMLTLRRQEQAA